MVGPDWPVPAPYAVIDSLVSLEVTNKDTDFDGFQMTLVWAEIRFWIMAAQLWSSGPPNRVIITAIIGVLPQVLIDGIITDHQVSSRAQTG